MMNYDVLIVGAGPVGLLLANLLGQAGVSCALLERRSALPAESRAIGITPPSLAILNRLGLDQPVIRAGLRVTEAVVHGDRHRLGRVRFDRLPGAYPFMLSLPQTVTMRLLEENIAEFAHVDYRPGLELRGLANGDQFAEVQLQSGERIRAEWLVGCDGAHSAIRELSGFAYRYRRYQPRFVMGDFEDDTGWGPTAHLFFTAHGSVESFPLPGGRRRWIALGGPDLLPRVQQITGADLHGSRQLSQSWFRPEYLLCRRYFAGRVILCGDAAHVMSPIGGQGMNTGFGDAVMLADALTGKGTLEQYEASRQRAFRVAAGRAARGMWLGSRTGWFMSALRGLFIGNILLRAPIRDRLPPYFAMLTIPAR